MLHFLSCKCDALFVSSWSNDDPCKFLYTKKKCIKLPLLSCQEVPGRIHFGCSHYQVTTNAMTAPLLEKFENINFLMQYCSC